MHCQAVQMEFAGKPATVFVCGPRKKFCRFCGAKATALCDWPRVRIVQVAFAELKVGDEVVSGPQSRQVHRLVYLEPKPERGEVWLATEWQGRVTQRVESQPWRGMWAPRAGTCDAPCCFRHARHVGPDRDYCRRHWDAWKQVT